MKILITILQLLCGLAIIVAVLVQSGKHAGLSGAIGGVADSFLAKNQAKTVDAKLARATKWIGAVFLILTLVLLSMGYSKRDAVRRLFFTLRSDTSHQPVARCHSNAAVLPLLRTNIPLFEVYL